MAENDILVASHQFKGVYMGIDVDGRWRILLKKDENWQKITELKLTRLFVDSEKYENALRLTLPFMPKEIVMSLPLIFECDCSFTITTLGTAAISSLKILNTDKSGLKQFKLRSA